jgi:hypothetical protein
MKMIQEMILPTANRGDQTFIISQSKKGYFAHELGGLTQFAQVVGGEERIAHRINKQVRYGNQHIRSWKQKPFSSIGEALIEIQKHSNSIIIYCTNG